MGEREESDACAQGTAVQRVRLEDLKPDPHQPRGKVKIDEELRQLAESLRDHGQQVPLDVWRDISDGKLVIKDGHRRYEAAKLAGLSELDCLLKPRPANATQCTTEQLVVNGHRADIPPMEKAEAYLKIANDEGLTGPELAKRLHVHPSTVSRTLKLLRLPPEQREKVAGGEASARKATRRAGPAFCRRFRCSNGLTIIAEADRKRTHMRDIKAACAEVISKCDGDGRANKGAAA
jgi:ParB family chromosome partitioning protein